MIPDDEVGCKICEKSIYRIFYEHVEKCLGETHIGGKERVLCESCRKPIHIDELGMITKGGFYHNKMPCLMVFFEKEKVSKILKKKVKRND